MRPLIRCLIFLLALILACLHAYYIPAYLLLSVTESPIVVINIKSFPHARLDLQLQSFNSRFFQVIICYLSVVKRGIMS